MCVPRASSDREAGVASQVQATRYGTTEVVHKGAECALCACSDREAGPVSQAQTTRYGTTFVHRGAESGPCAFRGRDNSALKS